MARLLLDTHVLLWANSEPARVRTSVLETMADRSNELLVSSVSAAEIEIKRAIGKLELPHTCETLVSGIGAAWLDLTGPHAMALRGLPSIHGDPFDRLLVAQTLVEEAVLVTADARLIDYPIGTLKAD